MRAALHLVVACLALCAAGAAAPGMVTIPTAIYRPPFRGDKDAREVPVAAFLLDERAVTNADFLVFVRENPK